MKPSETHKNNRGHNWLIYKITDRFLEKFIPHYTGAVYDLGCGDAVYKEFFLNHCDEYVGVDWGDSLHNVQVDIMADLNESLPIESEVADTVVSLSVMEHLRRPQLFLSESFRILRPNGKMILQVPWQWQVHEAPYDYFRYTPYGLKFLFEEAGFTSIEIYPTAGFFTTWVLKANYFSKRLIRGSKTMRAIVQASLRVFWFLGQKIAPVLDKYDNHWANESPGYFVLGSK